MYKHHSRWVESDCQSCHFSRLVPDNGQKWPFSLFLALCDVTYFESQTKFFDQNRFFQLLYIFYHYFLFYKKIFDFLSKILPESSSSLILITVIPVSVRSRIKVTSSHPSSPILFITSEVDVVPPAECFIKWIVSLYSHCCMRQHYSFHYELPLQVCAPSVGRVSCAL